MPTKLICFMVLVLGFISAAQSQEAKEEKLFKVYGFVKLNATYDFQNLGKSDLFKPSAIAIPEEDPNNPSFFMSAKQSRIGLAFNKETAAGNVKAVLEIDFHNTSTGIGGLARIRHAYLQWKGLTVGQTWSTFYDIQARPSIVDFEGPNSSTLNRAPLIRYEFPFKSSSLAFAIENPSEQITIIGDGKVENSTLPDFVAAYKIRWNKDKDFIKLAGVVRQLRYSPSENVIKEKGGSGVMINGKLTIFKKDNFKFQAVTGKGIARYIEGLRGLGYDGIFNEDSNTLETLNVYGGFLAYQHFWGEKWNSSLVLGTTKIKTNELLADNDLKTGNYGSFNLMYSPIKSMSFGWEYMHGKRENIDGNDGNASRIQFGATLKF